MRVLSFILISAALLCSCAHTSKKQRKPPIEIPDEYTLDLKGDTIANCWWESFGDECLNELIKEALGSNFTLKQARHRLEQASATARRAGAERIPQLNVNGSAARARSRGRNAMGQPELQTDNLFGLNLAASYEVDLWGRVSASKRAFVFDEMAARDNMQTAVITITAQITETWYRLAAVNENLALLQNQIANSTKQVRLLERRFETGQATALDVLQQREQLAGLQTQAPGIEALITTTQHRLSILIGQPPALFQSPVPAALSGLPPFPATGTPADLLNNRPDVRSALNRMRAADERVAVALADRLPALRLTASAGYSAPDAADLFDDWLWNIAGNLLAPVLDGGRRRAEADRTTAVAEERLAQFGEILLTAMREVEDALVNEAKQRKTLKCQTEQHKAVLQTLKQARLRYRRGLTDYLPVLGAFGREQSLTRSLIETRRQLISYRIQLYRALGGGIRQKNKGQNHE